MPDQSFQRTPIWNLEKPLSQDINQNVSQLDRSLRDTLSALFGAASGFIAAGLQVNPSSPPGLSVVINAGIGFQLGATDTPTNIGGAVGLCDLSPYKPIVLALPYTIAVPTPPVSNSRIDLIEVAYSRVLDNQQSRNFLDPSTSTFSPANVAKTLDFTVDGTLAYYSATATPTTALAYKSGVTASSPTPPATDTGYMALAYVTVVNGVTTITAADIADERTLIGGGRLINTQTITATGSYSPTPGTSRVHVQMCGGGGGGGGSSGGADASAGGGGGSGATLDFWVNASSLAGGACVIGAGGGGGTGNSGGTAGGDTTLAINGTTYTAKGGLPGGGEVNTSTPVTSSRGTVNSGSGPTGLVTGQNGEQGFVLSATAMTSGSGGSSSFGVGGAGRLSFSPGDGSAGSGYGAGGGGAESTSTDQTGGAGSAGVIVVEEFA